MFSATSVDCMNTMTDALDMGLENLKYIDDNGKKIEVRIPYVPTMNNGEMEKTAVFLKTLKNLTKVRILPFHNYAGSKYESLDIENTLPEKVPSEEEMTAVRNIFKSKGLTVAQ